MPENKVLFIIHIHNIYIEEKSIYIYAYTYIIHIYIYIYINKFISVEKEGQLDEVPTDFSAVNRSPDYPRVSKCSLERGFTGCFAEK